MSATDVEIERIVREVLEKLGVGDGSKAQPAAKQNETPKAAETKRQPASREELILSARVVTIDELTALNGAKRLIVPPKAVITPAARDVLRQRGVHVAYAVPKGQVKRRLAVGSSESGTEVAALVQRLRTDGIEVEQLANVGLGQMAAELADAIARSGYVGLWLTTNIAAALCLANRNPRVRAVCGADLGQLQRAMHEVGANLLIVAPGKLSEFQLRRQIVALCSTNIACPAGYQPWLA